MSNSDNELIEFLRELVTQQPTPPPGWEDDLIRRISETRVRSSLAPAGSRQGGQTHQRWRPLWAEIGAALAIAAVVVLSIQAFFHPGPRSISNGPVAVTAPDTTPSTRVSSPSPTAVGLSDFQPEALTAVSESTFWVLGTNSCAASGCVSEIMHTVNGGKSFHGIPAPPTDFLAGNVSSPGPQLVSDIRFADLSNGWVFGNTLWATHTGGAEWHQITFGGTLLGVDQLEPGANGYVYGVFEICTNPTTASGCVHRLMRSRASSDTWSLITPGNPVGRPIIGVHGDTVWAMYFMRSTGLEMISHDDGAFWVRGASACEPDLAGSLDPVSTTVIWAFCATGTAGGPMVSSNGGLAWASGGAIGGLFSNGGTVAALSTQHAFVADPGSGLSVTDNGGRTYQSIAVLNRAVWVGFTDFQVGYVITRNQNTQATALWRTTDAGASWSPVSFS